jgi:hypothetical protein
LIHKLLVWIRDFPKQVGALKAQHTPRATEDTFPTSQAAVFLDRYAIPGMPAHVDADRTIEWADTALNATRRVRNNISRRQRLATGCFASK